MGAEQKKHLYLYGIAIMRKGILIVYWFVFCFFLVDAENIDSEQTSQMNDSARQSEERISQLSSEQTDLKQQLEAQVRDNANLSRSVHLSVSLSFPSSVWLSVWICIYNIRCMAYVQCITLPSQFV